MASFFSNKKIYSTKATIAIVVIGEILIGFLLFHAGVAFGERHAFNRMSERGGPRPPEFGFFNHSFIPPEHGAIGSITSVASSSLTIKTRDGSTETISYSPQTKVENRTTTTNSVSTVEALPIGTIVVVIGYPDNSSSSIKAMLIRVLPTPAR